MELLKSFVPGLQLSPDMHLLLRYAADFMPRYGTIGLYGEQAVEAWEGHCNPVKIYRGVRSALTQSL